ncbi:lipid kinase [Sphingobium indicum]|nr:lipid kinase [Sphingobium indicum]
MVLASRPTRALLVINALSRSGAAMGEAAHRLLADQGCTVTRLDSRTFEEVSPWIAQRGDAADFVMVAGGDGTMNAAARGLLETGLPLALVPAGTANDLARTLGLGGCKLEQCVSLPAIGCTSKIDLGEANGHLFFNVASIGLSADLAQALTHEAKRRFGRWSYIIAALRALRAVRPFRATVSHDGQTVRVRTLQIAIGNGRYYGGGNAVHHEARIDDAALDLYSLELQRLWQLLVMYPAFKAGRHSLWREVRSARCDHFDVWTRRPRPVNLDGELKTFTPVSFKVLPAAISVFTP